MSDKKQVKVDNWGVYFLQRLKHFFNRTDYCDLTLQFQDNAQLKVHRLVLNACTEYFELLERTCEMYEDCLIMPEDLQADVVVPIVNFMYTGQLEFKQDLLEKLYHTSEIMNIPVLSKLLSAQRKPKPAVHYGQKNKRSFYNAFQYKKQTPEKKTSLPLPATKPEPKPISRPVIIPKPSKSTSFPYEPPITTHRSIETPRHLRQEDLYDPKPTRYEVPEDLVSDSIYDDSFSNISYESRPLMVHPETSKRYGKKTEFGIFSEASSSTSLGKGNSTIDIVECRKVNSAEDTIFEEEYKPTFEPKRHKPTKMNANKLFDQMLEETEAVPNITLETNDAKQAANIDHAKIISEVLKKYPHLVKNSKNIKLKIVDPQNTPEKKVSNKKKFPAIKTEVVSEDQYETEVLDSKAAAKLIAMGAENVSGPWICLICGTPGRAVHFTTYYSFRRHLVEVHNEKPIQNICEHCGLKSNKRNYLLHHMYTKHNITPPKAYKFPKCPDCDYVGLNESLLAKHKASHVPVQQHMPCNVCFKWFPSPSSLLQHIQKTGHKFSAEKKSLRCLYCPRMFAREANLYAHLKTNHRMLAIKDNILEESEEEEESKPIVLKREVETQESDYQSDNDDSNELQFTIQQGPDGKTSVLSTVPLKTSKQKILNSEVRNEAWVTKPTQINSEPIMNRTLNSEFLEEDEEVLANNAMDSEIIIRNDEFIPPAENNTNEFFINQVENATVNESPITSDAQQNTKPEEVLTKKVVSKNRTVNQPIQIVVSNEEEYKKLMGTNQSIIIDTEGSTKTLAVLTTPQANNIATPSVSTQANEMMILPDDYQLNVPENVSTSTGNIVVVYSHELSDPNKQFIVNPNYSEPQLVTSNINTQVLASSAVLTSSFGTTTTSGEQVVIPESMVSWQHDAENQATTDQLITIEQIQSTSNAVGVEPNSTNDMVELTEMHYVTSDQAQEIINTQQHVTPETENIVSQDVHENTEEVHEMEVEMSQETLENKDNESQGNVTSEPVHHIVAMPSDNDIEMSTSGIETEDTLGIENNSEQVVEQVNEDVHESNGIESEIRECHDSVETESQESAEIESAEAESEKSADDTMESSDVVPKTGEQIQNLASEWTEDEDEVHATTELVPESNVNNVDIEESIENIQQEVDKQTSETEGIVDQDEQEHVTNEVIDTPEQECIENDLNNDPMSTIVNEKSQEKISSLLNDWDDNDSQEGNGSVENGNVSQELEETEADLVSITPTEKEPQAVVQKASINNLVDDWEEDDEEDEKI